MAYLYSGLQAIFCCILNVTKIILYIEEKLIPGGLKKRCVPANDSSGTITLKVPIIISNCEAAAFNILFVILAYFCYALSCKIRFV